MVEDQLVCIYGVVSYIAVSVNIVVDKYDFFIERCNKFKSFGRNFRNDQSVQFRKLLFESGSHIMQLGITYDQGNKRIVRCAVRLNPSQNIIEIRIGVTISKRHDAADVELTFFSCILIVKFLCCFQNAFSCFLTCPKIGIVRKNFGNSSNGNVCRFCDFSNCSHNIPPCLVNIVSQKIENVNLNFM